MRISLSKFQRLFVCILSIGILSVAFTSLPVFAQPAGEPGPHGPGTPAPENAPANCKASLLGFPAWYNGIARGADCEIVSPTEVGGIANFIWIIVLNVVEMILRAAGYAAVAFIIYGGYKYMISAGSPDGMVAARKTILNAIIGLVISVAAIAIVRTITGALGATV